jgi:hypothetical protein
MHVTRFSHEYREYTYIYVLEAGHIRYPLVHGLSEEIPALMCVPSRLEDETESFLTAVNVLVVSLIIKRCVFN